MVAASKAGKKRFMMFLPISVALLVGQDEFLDSPGFDLARDDHVGIAAIHHVNHLETRSQLAGMTELAQHGPVQFHLVYLAGLGPGARTIAIGIGIGDEKILVVAVGGN